MDGDPEEEEAPPLVQEAGRAAANGSQNGQAPAADPLAGLRVGHGGGGMRGGRRAGGHRDLTTGSIPRNLWHLAWPQIIEGVLNVLDQMVDLLWAGRLPGGFRTLAGVGVAQTFTQFGMMARQGLDMAARAMISRAVGAGNIPLANHIALQAFTLTGVYSLIMIAVGVLFTDIFLRLIGASDAVQAEAAMYMRIQFIGMATQGFRMASGAALQSAGDVMSPLRATTLTRIAHIILTPFLIFGWWVFPEMGLAGAALANVVAQLAGCAVNFQALMGGRSRLHLTLRGYRVDYPLLWRMLKLGTPASLAGTERATAQLVLLGFVSPFGDVALAAYALTRRMEMFANFGSMGLGQASGILVGQNLGAGKPERARQAIGWALLYVGIMKSVVGAFIVAFPFLLITVFTSDTDVVELTSVWLRIQVFAAILMGMSMVFQQSFNTAGDTMAPLLVTLVGVWFVELPVAWLLSHTLGIGPLGIGWAAIAGMSARIVGYVPYFYWGRWLRVKVI
ncbi:MAG: MATE family efflux transporter [Chloroflexi bacterium]|nr:MATE family efflux transporter [Chloroflexota bacterium]